MTSTDQTTDLQLKFDNDGLVAAIAQDFQTKEVLMLAWMNQEAFEKTLATGEAHYWSRSRQSLWHKGSTSGAIQIIKEIKIDCDQDALLLLVEQKGQGACHTGQKSCFYRNIKNGGKLVFEDQKSPDK
ncbi:MAG: phosphoribosyl-AMP cyclohydrolase [Alphaproteobacteria bacterium]|nr:phosphoribosyl-AMP cyclohydrolase [Alphaproteobacteria bacterium]